MARTFTREAFHALVWSQPMTLLGKDFGLSDVALHKICRKHGIPVPPRGWWARKAAGQVVHVTKLPPVAGDLENRVVIASRELGAEHDNLAEAREAARIRASAAPEVKASRSHPVVRRTIAALREATPAHTGLVTADADAGLVRCDVAKASLDRLESVLANIVAAAAQQGFELVADGHPARFVGPKESVGLSISETYRRVKHQLTDQEKAAEAKWQRLCERHNRRPWDLDWSKQPRVAEWDWLPTGQLAVELEGAYVRDAVPPRRKFADGRVQRLEELASDIAVGLAVTAAAMHASRLRAEEEQRRAAEARRQRELALRAAHIEERRTGALAAVLGELAALDRLQRLLANLEQSVTDPAGSRVEEFKAWAGRHLANREAALSASGLAAMFERERLFGDDDDHAFRASPDSSRG